jgi:hypothetical protein
MSKKPNTNKRLLDRNSYSPLTISTFSVIGAYVVDIYYNHTYAEAVKLKNSGKVASITEGYKHAVLAFMSAIDNQSKTYKPKYYTQLLTGINEYFTVWTSFSTLTVGDCIDRITKEFIPGDYYASLDKDQKRNILRLVLTNTIKEFTKCVIQEYLGSIIDNHDEPANVEALKDKMTDLLLMEREALYHRFLDSNSGKKAETVDKNLAVRMQQEIKTLGAEKVKLLRVNTDLESKLEMRNEQVSELLDKYKTLLRKFKGLKEEYAVLQTRLQAPEESEYTRGYNDDDNDSEDLTLSREPMRGGREYQQPPVQAPVPPPVQLPPPPKAKAPRKTPPKKNTNTSNNTVESSVPSKQDMQELLNKHIKKSEPVQVEPPALTTTQQPQVLTITSSNSDDDNEPPEHIDEPEEVIQEKNLDRRTSSMKQSLNKIKRIDMGDEPSISDIY